MDKDKLVERDPHVAIVEAAKRGKGLRLTAAEVAYLAEDSAIASRAAFVTHPSSGETLPTFITRRSAAALRSHAQPK